MHESRMKRAIGEMIFRYWTGAVCALREYLDFFFVDGLDFSSVFLI